MQMHEKEHWRDPSEKSNLYDGFIDGGKILVIEWQIDLSN